MGGGGGGGGGGGQSPQQIAQMLAGMTLDEQARVAAQMGMTPEEMAVGAARLEGEGTHRTAGGGEEEEGDSVHAAIRGLMLAGGPLHRYQRVPDSTTGTGTPAPQCVWGPVDQLLSPTVVQGTLSDRDIVSMLNLSCSARTVRRIRGELGLSRRAGDDVHAAVDDLVAFTRQHTSQWIGRQRVEGFLYQMGYRIPHDIVDASLSRQNPARWAMSSFCPATEVRHT